MPTADEMFKHIHDDGLCDLERNRTAGVEDAAAPVPGEPTAKAVLREEYRKMMDTIIESLRVERPDPEVVLRKGLVALNHIQQFRWLVENLLEAVKRDDSMNNSLMRFVSLGLIDAAASSNLTEEKRQSPWPFNPGSGRFLIKLWDRLQRVALIVMELVINAIKVIPRLIALKPKPSIGLAGPFPTFSLAFELEADSITLHELFKDLKGAHT